MILICYDVDFVRNQFFIMMCSLHRILCGCNNDFDYFNDNIFSYNNDFSGLKLNYDIIVVNDDFKPTMILYIF